MTMTGRRRPAANTSTSDDWSPSGSATSGFVAESPTVAHLRSIECQDLTNPLTAIDEVQKIKPREKGVSNSANSEYSKWVHREHGMVTKAPKDANKVEKGMNSFFLGLMWLCTAVVVEAISISVGAYYGRQISMKN
eukprot:gnl/MRDRNA2_/MRDRNA2_140596_c0_seq1.p1 gnl/MRDRNA2_/MRDRNA2_140596_c0~~gnl/MRDRNA2_/MRDRNA2_140596_c0_seq1.p1  ORF type:complete len:136 (-),score=19.81 gnl/MRDRNA2_/MRDRNA2_140596_c0_seq1:18-425(-)